MATTTLPVEYDLTIYSGATFRIEFRWLPDGNDPQDFTGWAGTMRLGNQRQALATLTSGSGGVIMSATGQVILTMLPSITAGLPSGSYSYNVDLTDPAGTVTRFLRGQVKVIKDVGGS